MTYKELLENTANLGLSNKVASNYKKKSSNDIIDEFGNLDDITFVEKVLERFPKKEKVIIQVMFDVENTVHAYVRMSAEEYLSIGKDRYDYKKEFCIRRWKYIPGFTKQKHRIFWQFTAEEDGFFICRCLNEKEPWEQEFFDLDGNSLGKKKTKFEYTLTNAKMLYNVLKSFKLNPTK